MEIDVRNFLNADVGHKEIHDIDEQKEMKLTEEATLVATRGRINVLSLENDVLVTFNLRIKYKLMCVRCLEDFDGEQDLGFEREYSFREKEDKIKINKSLKVDIEGPIREEAILNLPMKAICKEKCKGVR